MYKGSNWNDAKNKIKNSLGIDVADFEKGIGNGIYLSTGEFPQMFFDDYHFDYLEDFIKLVENNIDNNFIYQEFEYCIDKSKIKFIITNHRY